MTYLDNFVTDSIRNWYVDGDEIYNAYGGYNIDVGYGGVRLSRAKIYGNSYENDTWIFEKIDEVSSGIQLIDEYYDIDTVNKRYMAINSTKSLEDFKIRCLRYSTVGLPEYVWSTSNENIATVNATTGEVTAIGVGEAVITVTQPGLLINNSASYTIQVLPFKDGLYSFVNNLGYDGLELFNINNEYFFKRASSQSNNIKWYMQTTIDGEYLISIADNKEVKELRMLGCKERYDTEGDYMGLFATLNQLTDEIFDLPTWNIKSHDLGYTFEYESDSDSSLFILDDDNSLVELGMPDYEDNESMWSISEIISLSGQSKLYLYPYYDNELVSFYYNNQDYTIVSINSYMDEIKETLEREIGVQVEVLEPEYFDKSEISNLNNKDLYRKELAKMFAAEELADPYYRNSHKYIIFSGYDFGSGNRSGSDNDIAIITAYGNKDENGVIIHDSLIYKALHETSHLIGALDHYHTGTICKSGDKCTTCGTLQYKRPESCILHYYDYDKENPFCNECKMDMIMNVNGKCIE